MGNDIDNILIDLVKSDADLAQALGKVDKQALARELVKQLEALAPKKGSGIGDKIGYVFGELFGMHSAEAAAFAPVAWKLAQEALKCGVRSVYGKELLKALVKVTGSKFEQIITIKADARLIARPEGWEHFYWPEHFNEPLNKKKAQEKSDNKKPKETSQSKGGSGFMPDLEPDDEEKRFKLGNVQDSAKIGNTPYGKIYKDPLGQKWNGKDIWFSKDNAQHGGSKFKVYIKGAEKFNWIADLDETGKIMNKHKSTIGETISFKDIGWIK